jgi:hypothetical protein
LRWKQKRLTRANIAGLIEIYVSNPDLSMITIALKFGINPGNASAIITNHFFYIKQSETTQNIVKSSAMNDEIELKQSA